MHDRAKPENSDPESSDPESSDNAPEVIPGEFDRLLREIETEAVPERLLELALKLQAALVEQRRKTEAGEGERVEGI